MPYRHLCSNVYPELKSNYLPLFSKVPTITIPPSNNPVLPPVFHGLWMVPQLIKAIKQLCGNGFWIFLLPPFLCWIHWQVWCSSILNLSNCSLFSTQTPHSLNHCPMSLPFTEALSTRVAHLPPVFYSVTTSLLDFAWLPCSPSFLQPGNCFFWGVSGNCPFFPRLGLRLLFVFLVFLSRNPQ